MEFYNQPVKDTFLTDRLKWFEMPLEGGGSTTVIAVETKESTYWVVTYTILVAAIFVAVARLFTGLILSYASLCGSGNRYVMLVSFYNAVSPVTAALQMWGYVHRAVFNSRRNGRWAINRGTLSFALSLALLAGANFLIGNATKFLVTSRLVVNNAARANPAAMYYPEIISDENDPRYQLVFELVQPVRTAGAYQALGRVQTARSKVEDAVHFSSNVQVDDDGRPNLELSYSYSITGSNMGLQRAAELVYTVSGQCVTRYNWLDTTRGDVYDWYPVWGTNDSATNDIADVDMQSDHPAWANIFPPPDEVERSKQSHGFEFVLVPNISHRKSRVPNLDDPWYLTEETPDWLAANETERAGMIPYRVQRGRPPVHCWQNDTWSLGDDKVFHVDDLHKLGGLRLSQFLQKTLFPREFAVPPMIQIGNNLGYVALSSSLETVVNTRTIYAARCKALNDLERLVHLSYVSSREVVRNTILLYSTLSSHSELNNLATEGTGTVAEESADFIVESKDVTTLSVPTLITVPCLCVFLWILTFIFGTMYYNGMKASNDGPVSRYNHRAIALQASQLYRYLDEQISGKRKWSGRMSMAPYIKDIESDQGYNRVGSDIDVRESIPVSAAGRPGVPNWPGDNKSRYIRPKLVQIPTDSSPDTERGSPDVEAQVDPKSGVQIEHNEPSRRLYELVMTRHWQSIQKYGLVKFENIEKDL